MPVACHAYLMGSKWTAQAVKFMGQTIRGGGVRHVGSQSQFHTLALNLAVDHGMLSIKHYYRAGRQGVAVYEVTDKGKQTFGEAK